VTSLAFAPDGRTIAAMTWEGAVVVALAPVMQLEQGHAETACPWGPIVSPDGRYVLSPAASGGVAVSAPDGRRLRLLEPLSSDAVPVQPVPAISGDGSMVAIATSRCGNIHAVGERFGTGVWRVDAPQPVMSLPDRAADSVQLDARGSVLVLGAVALAVPSGERLPALEGVRAFTADGRGAFRITSGRQEVVQVPSGAVIATLAEP